MADTSEVSICCYALARKCLFLPIFSYIFADIVVTNDFALFFFYTLLLLLLSLLLFAINIVIISIVMIIIVVINIIIGII